MHGHFLGIAQREEKEEDEQDGRDQSGNYFHGVILFWAGRYDGLRSELKNERKKRARQPRVTTEPEPRTQKANVSIERKIERLALRPLIDARNIVAPSRKIGPESLASEVKAELYVKKNGIQRCRSFC
ncbi:hypothetical protein [Herbaspirillum robiniae]|uniref:hypothetical protein n=1 Tax=Herbaspirillum robiniae TaxID=2014887 RepID=UPI003D76E1F9